MCDGLLFDLIRSWFEFLTVYQARYHAHHAAETFFAFDLFPLYFLQIHALLPSVHHSILQQLSCGLARRQGQPTPTEYIKSGMKARWPQGLEFTRSCFLLSSPNWATQLVEMILCHCNVFVVTDVNICRGWGIPRFCSHRRLQVPRSVDGRTAEPAFSLHPNAFAANHRGRTGEMCFSRHQHDDQKRGDFAPSVEEWALAGTLTNQITWRTKKRESTCGTHSLRKAFSTPPTTICFSWTVTLWTGSRSMKPRSAGRVEPGPVVGVEEGFVVRVPSRGSVHRTASEGCGEGEVR